jgi:DNA polymerase-3 subunit beta
VNQKLKVVCDRKALTDAFMAVSGVVPSRTVKEILKNVKLQVSGGVVTLIGTDGEVGMRCAVPDVTADNDGEALLPTGRVVQVLREIKGESITLELDGTKFWIRSGSSEFRLSAEDPAEFPQVAEFGDDAFCVMQANDLRRMIRRTVFACDVDSTRYALGGVMLELSPERATFAATDSRRLAVVRGGCRAEGSVTAASPAPVVPAKAMALIERILGEGNTETRIAVHPNDVAIQCGGVTITSQLVQGRFPDYRKVVPDKFNATVDLVVGPFHSAVRQAQIVTSEESRGVDFTFTNGTLRLSSQVADVGQSKIELPISYAGKDLTTTFDPRYIADFLKVLDPGTSVHFQLIDHESAAVLMTDDHYTYVIMPLSRDKN